MDPSHLDELQRTLSSKGPEAAIEQLCTVLRSQKDYANLFYALLLKKRHALGVSPVPTEGANELPEAVHVPYEEAIREAGRLVGQLYLDEGDIPHAWMYYRMLGETEPVAKALERYQFKEEEDPQQLIEIAFHHGVHPRKGFDWILDRYGICSTITTVSGHQFPDPAVREYCIRGLVRALYEQLRQRLAEEVARHEGKAPEGQSVRQLMAGKDYLFEDDFYHVDVSHLSSIVQMSVHLSRGAELDMARELCAYGQRLSPRFQYAGDPPFEEQYRDYGIYLSVLAGDKVDEGIAHFRAKAENADPETVGTFPAEVLVNLLVRIDRPAEALQVARQFLTKPQSTPSSCPSIVELCRQTRDYKTLAEVAREQGDPVHFMAGLLAGNTFTPKGVAQHSPGSR
ncbi:MAG TPA: hypothetical protein VG099_16375 [Gemmataceae bacterium]|nr:hypothetical protein [Gemmataceae bacterium]